MDEAPPACRSCSKASTNAIDPKVASAATAAAVVPRRVWRTTGASARPGGGVTYMAAADVLVDTDRLLPRCGACICTAEVLVPTWMFREAGGARSGHSLCQRAALDSFASNACLFGGMLKLQWDGNG